MISHFKRLSKHILVYGLGDTVNKLLAIFIVPLFTRYLSPVDYGVSGVLIVTNVLIIGLADLGLSSGVVRFLKEEKEPQRSRLVSTAQMTMVAITLSIALIALFFGEAISQVFFQTPEYSYIIALNFFSIPLTLATSVPMMRWRLEEKSKLFAAFTLTKVATGLGLNILFIVFLRRGITGLFESSLINAMIYALVANFDLIYQKTSFSFSRNLFKKMFLFGFPFVFSSVSIWILNWADRFVLARMTNLSETGLYTLGYSIGMAIMLPVGAFTAAWVPFYMSVSDQPNAQKIYAYSATYYSLVCGFFILLIAVFSRDYFYFFTPEKFHSAYIIVPMITLAYALKGLFSVTIIGSFLSKKTIYPLISEAIAMAINIGLMFILIPVMGRMGAAWATLAAYAILPFLIIYLTNRFYPIKYEYGRFTQILFVGLAIYFICQKIYEPTLLNVLIRFGIIILYPLGLFLVGFFREGEKEKIKSFKINLQRIFLGRKIK